ncbi:MAG: homoserine kinase [Stackebrandtia sp.]
MSYATLTATVRVPATSANLGPGFDSLGLALSLFDEVTARPSRRSTFVTVEGEGAGELPDGESHLVASSMRAAFESCGAVAPPVRLHCRNAIPQARGLGSSSAAIVAGVCLARRIMGDGAMTDDDALRVASRIEGHPDNVAPCLLGGFVIAWTDADGARAVRREPASGLAPAVNVPQARGLTRQARAALPELVPHADAVFNVARAALAVHAFTSDPSLLWEATDDRLHQPYRAEAAPESFALTRRLRAEGVPAMISGAGPSVLAFAEHPPPADGFHVRTLRVCDGARTL